MLAKYIDTIYAAPRVRTVVINAPATLYSRTGTHSSSEWTQYTAFNHSIYSSHLVVPLDV